MANIAGFPGSLTTEQAPELQSSRVCATPVVPSLQKPNHVPKCSAKYHPGHHFLEIRYEAFFPCNVNTYLSQLIS